MRGHLCAIATATVAVMGLAGGVLPASAAVITFDGGVLDNTANTYTEDGYVFHPIGPGDLPSGNCPTDDPDCLKLALTTQDAAAEMTRVDNGSFSLSSLDVQFDGSGGSPILSIYRNDLSNVLEFCLEGNTDTSCDHFTDEAFSSQDSSTGPDDFHFDFTKLAEFDSFFKDASSFFFDNDAERDQGTLRLDNIAAVNAVPVPATLPLLLCALAGFGYLGRKRFAAAA